MAQPYVRGPIGLHVQIGGTIFFLGTGERAPRISIKREYEALRSDIAGTRLGLDQSFQGQEAFVTVKLTRWNETILTRLQDSTGAFGVTPGSDNMGDVGTLMVFEGQAFPLWVQFPYGAGQFAAKTAYANPTNGAQMGGYHFFAAILEGEQVLEGGTDPASVSLTFHCYRVFSPTTLSLALYDFNMTGLSSWN